MSRLIRLASKNKGALLLGLFFVLFFSFSPVGFLKMNYASASWWDFWNWGSDIVNLGKNLLIGLPIALVAILSYFIMLLAGICAGLLGTLMTWIINASLNIQVIPGPGTVSVVNVGWQFTRDLMNMFFILILVFIGLATILRLQSYEVKKTLPLLIIMALLINFSGVLVGAIVDVSNIITNFFVSGLNTFNSSFSIIWQNTMGIVGGLGNFFGDATAEPSEYVEKVVDPLGQIITAAAFFCILDIVLLAIVLIFLLRTIYLWIIVILAPIAFASYVLPATRGFWNSWWKNLIQWSIVGIPISFSLYLGNIILLHQDEVSQAFGNLPQFEGNWFAPLLAQFLAPATVIFLLFYGIGVSIAGAPTAAKKVMESGQKATRAVGTTYGKKTWGWTKGAAAAPFKEGRNLYNRYEMGRTVNPATGRPDMSVREAIGSAISGYRHRVGLAITPRPVGRAVKSAGEGIFSAIKESATAGARKGFGLKKKGMRDCPNRDCITRKVVPPPGTVPPEFGRKLSANAKECKYCGEDLS